jgi:hypothetical protein
MQNDMEAMASSNAVSMRTDFPNLKASIKAHGHPLAAQHSLKLTQPEKTYWFQVEGHNWADQGIYDGDIAIVDRAIKPQAGSLVINWHENGFSICKYWKALATDEPLGVITGIVRRLAP